MTNAKKINKKKRGKKQKRDEEKRQREEKAKQMEDERKKKLKEDEIEIEKRIENLNLVKDINELYKDLNDPDVAATVFGTKLESLDFITGLEERFQNPQDPVLHGLLKSSSATIIKKLDDANLLIKFLEWVPEMAGTVASKLSGVINKQVLLPLLNEARFTNDKDPVLRLLYYKLSIELCKELAKAGMLSKFFAWPRAEERKVLNKFFYQQLSAYRNFKTDPMYEEMLRYYCKAHVSESTAEAAMKVYKKGYGIESVLVTETDVKNCGTFAFNSSSQSQYVGLMWVPATKMVLELGSSDLYQSMALVLREASEMNDANWRPCPEVSAAFRSESCKACVTNMALMQTLLVSKERMKKIREMCGLNTEDIMRSIVSWM